VGYLVLWGFGGCSFVFVCVDWVFFLVLGFLLSGCFFFFFFFLMFFFCFVVGFWCCSCGGCLVAFLGFFLFVFLFGMVLVV